jgi:hypothetical protein
MQSGSDSSWLLPRVYMNSVYMTRIPIELRLYSKIFLIHQPHRSVFPNVFIISTRAFAEFDHDTTKNVIGV